MTTNPTTYPRRVITAQDSTTPRVLVTYLAGDLVRTTERVSYHLASVLEAESLAEIEVGS